VFKWEITKQFLLIWTKIKNKENLNLIILIGHLMGNIISFKKN